MARPVGAVDDRQATRLARTTSDLADGEDERGRRRDVAEEERSRPIGDSGEERVGDRVRVSGERERQLGAGVPRARLLAEVAPHEVASAVLVIGRDDLVPARWRSDRATAFTAEVAFGTRTRSLGRAPT